MNVFQTRHLLLGATNKRTGEYTFPSDGSKTESYICPEGDCNKPVVLCQGIKICSYFRHKAGCACYRYEKPTQYQIHSDAIKLLKLLLEKGINLTIISRCLNSKCKMVEEYEIPSISVSSEFIEEYRFEYNGKKYADLAYLDHGEVVCIFEIYNTHRTPYDRRPQDIWFELDAKALLSMIITEDVQSLKLDCIRGNHDNPSGLCNACHYLHMLKQRERERKLLLKQKRERWRKIEMEERQEEFLREQEERRKQLEKDRIKAEIERKKQQEADREQKEMRKMEKEDLRTIQRKIERDLLLERRRQEIEAEREKRRQEMEAEREKRRQEEEKQKRKRMEIERRIQERTAMENEDVRTIQHRRNRMLQFEDTTCSGCKVNVCQCVNTQFEKDSSNRLRCTFCNKGKCKCRTIKSFLISKH